MPRQLRRAHRIAGILAVLMIPALAHAAPKPPAFLGTFTSPGLCSPRGIALSPSGDVFVGSCDCLGAMHMEHFTTAGGLLGTWGFTETYLGCPNGVALDGSGNVFVTDYDGSQVLKYTSSGVLVTTWGSFGSGPGQFEGPVDVATNSSGEVFVSEINGTRVQKFTNGGAYLATIGLVGQFQSPNGIGLDAGGRLYVADNARMRILRFQANGNFDMEFATPAAPYDVAVGPDGNVYVVYIAGSGGQVFSTSGVLLHGFQSSDALAGGPFRIAIGPTGVMYVTEQFLNANRVMMFQIDQTTAATRTTFGRLKAMYR